MEWVSTNPDKSGKYIVETKTMMGNSNKFEAYYNGKTWNFTNQTFVKYLKEDQYETVYFKHRSNRAWFYTFYTRTLFSVYILYSCAAYYAISISYDGYELWDR